MTRRVFLAGLNGGPGGLLNVKSQLAWPKKLNISTNLPPIVNNDDLDSASRSDQGQVSRWLQSPRRCNRVAPLNDDATDDVDRQERRHHSRGRKKCRRHRHDQQLQTLVHSAGPTGGHQSSDT